jgi:hypothetical protein
MKQKPSFGKLSVQALAMFQRQSTPEKRSAKLFMEEKKRVPKNAWSARYTSVKNHKGWCWR